MYSYSAWKPNTELLQLSILLAYITEILTYTSIIEGYQEKRHATMQQ
jgi:hypothetical protein